MKSKNYVLKLGLILFVITFAVGLLLSVVNAVTYDTIKAAEKREIDNAIIAIFPNADSVDEATGDFDESVKAVYLAKSGGELVGVAVNNVSNGFGGDIDMITGFNADKTIAGVKIISMSETPGLGAKANNPGFLEQYTGKTTDLSVIKNAAPQDNEIAAITGATITSTAVTTGVNAAYAAAQPFLEGGGK